MNTSPITKRHFLVVIAALVAASSASAVTKQRTKSNNTNERAATEAIAPSDASSGPVRRGAEASVRPGTLQVGTRAGAKGVEVLVALSGGATFAWSATTGTVNPVPAENVNPTSGIGIVVKKNPGSSAARTLPVNGEGGVSLPADMEDGRYDMTVSVPRQSVNLNASGKSRSAGTATFALVLVKNSSGLVLMAPKPDQAIRTKGTNGT